MRLFACLGLGQSLARTVGGKAPLRIPHHKPTLRNVWGWNSYYLWDLTNNPLCRNILSTHASKSSQNKYGGERSSQSLSLTHSVSTDNFRNISVTQFPHVTNVNDNSTYQKNPVIKKTKTRKKSNLLMQFKKSQN